MSPRQFCPVTALDSFFQPSVYKKNQITSVIDKETESIIAQKKYLCEACQNVVNQGTNKQTPLL